MSRPDRTRVTDHVFATSQAGGQADQSHDVRHAAGRRHRLQKQRRPAGRVTPCVHLAGGLAAHCRQANRNA